MAAKIKSVSQLNHEKLIKFLRTLDPAFEGAAIQKHLLYAKDVSDQMELSHADTHGAAILLKFFFNTYSGSAGEHNFYRLLECYLLDKKKRAQINEIIAWS